MMGTDLSRFPFLHEILASARYSKNSVMHENAGVGFEPTSALSLFNMWVAKK